MDLTLEKELIPYVGLTLNESQPTALKLLTRIGARFQKEDGNWYTLTVVFNEKYNGKSYYIFGSRLIEKT